MYLNTYSRTALHHLTLILFSILILLTISYERAGAKSMWKLNEPIVTYWAGPSITDETAKVMKDGGWNVIWCTEKELDTAQKLGLKAMLHDGLLSPSVLNDPDKVKELEKLIDRVKNHPAMYSYFLGDEPNASLFPQIGKMVAFLKKHDPAHFAYANLFPTYASNEQLGTSGDKVTAYQEYLDRYVSEVKPLLISYDNYQFFVGGDGDDYFLNLELVRKAGLKYKLPFLNIIQASSWTPEVRVPNGDELRFLTYTTLAYGGLGLSHYVYNYPVDHKGMIIGNDGQPTHLYHAAKWLNPEFEKIAGVLINCKSIGTYHVGMVPPGTTALPEDAPFKVQSDVLNEEGASTWISKKPVKGFVMGYFAEAGKRKPSKVVVVNLDYTKSVKATITGPGKLEVFNAATGEWRPAFGKSVELDLMPGGGVLVGLADSK